MRTKAPAVLGVTMLMLGFASASRANDLKAADVFALKAEDAVPMALDDSEMHALRGGLGLAFSVFWSARMENLAVEATDATAPDGTVTPDDAFNAAVTLADGEGKVAAFFGNANGFNGIIQNIQAAGGSNNVFTNIMNIQVFLVTVANTADIPSALNTFLTRF